MREEDEDRREEKGSRRGRGDMENGRGRGDMEEEEEGSLQAAQAGSEQKCGNAKCIMCTTLDRLVASSFEIQIQIQTNKEMQKRQVHYVHQPRQVCLHLCFWQKKIFF